MNQVILRDWYCEKCSLQFDKKYVYDLHLKLVHGQEIKLKQSQQLVKKSLKSFNRGKKFCQIILAKSYYREVARWEISMKNI